MAEAASKDELKRRLLIAKAELMAYWEGQGGGIAKKYGYTGLSGIDAVHRLIIDRTHWTPDTVRRLTIDEIDLVLAGVDLG